MRHSISVIDEAPKLFNHKHRRNKSAINSMYGISSNSWRGKRRIKKLILSMEIQYKLNMAQHIIIRNTGILAEYLADNSIKHIKISSKVYEAYTKKVKTTRDILLVKHLFSNVKDWLMFIDTKHKLILFYNIDNKKENFWSDDKDLKEYIKQEMVRQMVNRL